MPIDRRRQTAIIQGLIFGAGFGVMQGLLQRSLPYGVRGRPVHDPALGPATIVHAGQVEDRARGSRWGLVLVWIFLAERGRSRAGPGPASAVAATGAGFSLAVWVLILLIGTPLERRTMTNARAAQQAAQRLLAPP